MKTTRSSRAARLTRALATVMLLAGGLAAHAEGYRPADDAEIVETLPTLGAYAAEQRELRRRMARQPTDAPTALALSRSLLERARTEGDARLAGQALGALAAWEGDAQAPTSIRLQRATLLQHLHDFDGAKAELATVLQQTPRHPQALLTLATIDRVQGEYDASDRACVALQAAGEALYARACLSENQALRGDSFTARTELEALLAVAPEDAGWTSWIRTTLGELELRAGRPDQAIEHLAAALQASPGDPYAKLALTDTFIAQRRWREAEALLKNAGDGNAALLRRAIVARGLGTANADTLRSELAARYSQAALRPEAKSVHAREQAWFALDVEGDATRALALARLNVRTQREAIDVLLLARAARGAGDEAALGEAMSLARRIGLHDARLQSLAPPRT